MRKIIRVPQLETDRLILRMWTKRDARDLFEYARNPEVGPPAGWKPHASVYESKTIIEDVFRQSMTWAIVEKTVGKPVGSIGLDNDGIRTGIASRELGYSLARNCWGRGYMTEAARRVIKYAFDELSLQVLMIKTGETNERSRNVILKCGFKQEGTLRRANRLYDGSIRDVIYHSMLREEYEELYLE